MQAPDEDEPEALSMAWPSGTKDRITYLLVAPIIFPLWLTLPDTRTPRGKKFFPVTFIGSIVWIAIYSYLMVWWANVAGDTANIPPEVSSLSICAHDNENDSLIFSVSLFSTFFHPPEINHSCR
jgi:sodium/potassium/calcium exchanger 2